MASVGKEKKLHKQSTMQSFGQDDPFNAKSSLKGKSRMQQQVLNNPTQTVVVKSRLPFNALVEESGHIKERTNNLFLTRFEGKLDEKNKIIPTTLPSNAYHGTRRNSSVNIQFNGVLESLKEGQLTEEDSFVPKSTAVKLSIFPAGDKKIFPERRPHTGCWKLGLRQYEQTHKQSAESDALSGATSKTDLDQGLDAVSVGSVESTKSIVNKRLVGGAKALGKLRRQASDDSFNMRPANSVKQMNTYLHAQYASTDLPKPTKDQNKNYFGTSGTENFFKTYKELKQRGEVLLDGYAALEELVLLPEQDNVLLSSIKSLENLGVLTPRDTTMTHVDDFSLHDDNSSIGSDGGHFTPFSNSPKSPHSSKQGFVPDLLAQRVMSFNKLAHDPNVATAVSLFAEHGKNSAGAAEALTPAAQAEKERLEKVAAERHRLMNIHAASGSTPVDPAHNNHNSLNHDGVAPQHLPSRHASSPELSAHRKNLTNANTLANTGTSSSLNAATAPTANKLSLAGILKAQKASKNFTSLRSISRLESLPPIHVNNKTIITNTYSTNNSFTNSAASSVHGKSGDFGTNKGKNGQNSGALPRPGLSRGSTARSALSGITASTARPPSPTELGEPVFVHVEEEPEKDHFGLESDSDSESTEFAQRIYSSQPFAAANSKKWSGIDPNKDVAVLDLTPFVRRLDEPLPDDLALDSSYSVASPRAVFLAGCLQHNIPPITVALIRKKISSTINLAHMGLGTKVAKVLAPCLKSIPYLQLLNLTDNNLDDEGLSVLLHAVSQHKTIEILDISQNIIGSNAAAALAVMLGDPNYTLQCLRMSSANIDDGECANFVEVLMNNRHLKELDMSNNLLGKDENLNAVQPDFVTGGESLSELLSNPNCPLRTLNLHWNMIRLEGAEVLCNSLRTNRVLTNLDLSYNALGNAAGVLGAALIENNILVELNVGNNAIDEFGCFTLMAGVRENKSLRNLVLDGNPLGVQGGRILIKVATALGNRLNISAKNCDFNIHNSNFKFNINEPYGEFTLDLAVPYERAVVLEVLNIGQIDTSIEFTKFEYCDQSGAAAANAAFVPMKLVRFEQPITEFSRAETRELQDLTALSAISEHSWEDLFHIAQRYCTLDPEVLVKADTEKLLKEIKVNDMNTVIGEIFFTLDPMQFGWIDLYEFVGYMIKRSNAAKSRIHSMKHDSIFAVATNPGVRYIPPLTGKIRVRTVEGFNCDPDTVTFKPISNSQCRQVLKCADNSSHPLSLIIFAIEATRLHIEEAKLMYRQVMSKTEDSIMAIAVILQHMRSTDDALRVLKQFIGTDILRWRRLKQRLGSTLLPLIGIYSGFYHLDLSYPADRVCLKKLIERSVKNCDYRMKNKLGDTSQHGNWTCFRNEHHLDRPEERICPKYYYPMPEKAKLDFDFINIDRPDVTLHRAVGEDSIIDLLLMCRLLDEHLVDWALAKLKELGASARKSVLSNGKPVWKTEVGRAVAVNDTVYSFYNNLSSRHKSYLKSQKRETMTKNAPTTSNKDAGAKKGKAGHHGDDHHGHHSKAGVKRTSMVERDRMREEKEKQAKLLAAANKNLDIVTFRSFNLKGKQHQMKAFWSKRLFEVMYESNGTDEMKSAAIIEFLEIMMSTWWIYCRHLSLILELFSIGSVAKSSMGSYRVELIVMWFDHILDIQNFEQVLMVLNAEEQAAVYSRIGILNIFNPCKPEGGWQLDLMRWEERQVAKMLIHLSVVEPGENWFEPVFIFDHGFQPAPGWSLSVVWLTDAGLPLKGVLTLEFFSGGGANMQNCLVDRRLRALLCTLTLVSKRDLPLEYKINKQENFAVGLERKDSFDPNNPLLANLVGAVLKAATGDEQSSAPAVTAASTAVLSGTSTPGTELQPERGERAGHHHHNNADGHSETDAAHTAGRSQLQAFVRPHAVPLYTPLRGQINLMPQLYFDAQQHKVVMDHTYRDCNAHLKTCNVEWTYADADNFKVDPWRL